MMADKAPPVMGTIGWMDLTVPNAGEVKDFYAAVAGWKQVGVAMGEYEDYAMLPASAEAPVGGICHARGANATLPPVWLIYIYVPNLDEALDACRSRGGTVVTDPRTLEGYGRFSVIRDPAGAHAALFEPEAKKQDD